MHFLAIAAVLSAGLASAYDLPANLQQIYNKHKV
jgi:chitosanase